jgi:hypothetical protein
MWFLVQHSQLFFQEQMLFKKQTKAGPFVAQLLE